MSALLIAAALVVAPVTPKACANYFKPTPATSQTRPAPGLTKLADLPKAALILPVERMVDGCPVPKVVRYDADRDGRFTKAP